MAHCRLREEKMLLSTVEDLAKFVEELRRESDRGLALVAAALIDDILDGQVAHAS